MAAVSIRYKDSLHQNRFSAYTPQKGAEVQMDRSSAKQGSLTQSQGGKERPAYDKK
jgi:hypothetical protein